MKLPCVHRHEYAVPNEDLRPRFSFGLCTGTNKKSQNIKDEIPKPYVSYYKCDIV